MTIDQQGRKWWDRAAAAPKAAFLSCVITGYLVHLYAFTNLIPNCDGLSRVFDTQQMTVSGRWFLHYASALNSFTQMPAAIGLLSLLFLGLAAAFAVDLLKLRSKLLAGLAGAVMAAFPCMGYTFLYMFTASAYCLAIFLAVLSVWLAKRCKVGWLCGVLALALAMGTYQAYVTVAISLSLLVVLRECLDPESGFQGTLALGLRLVAYLAAGAILYYGILLVFLKVKDLKLLSYLGMDAASSGYPFGKLPHLLLSTYKQVVAFFFVAGSSDGFTSRWMVVLDLAALVLGLCFFLARLSGKGLWKEVWRPLGALAMAALLPLGINFMQVLSPYSVPTPLMKYAFVTVYLAVLLVADLADGLPNTSTQRGTALSVAVVWAAVLLLFCLNTNNLLYTASAQAHRASESYATRLLSRIEDCPGYEPGMEIALVGAVPADQIKSQIPSYAQVDHYSVPLNSVISLNKHLYYYLNDWLNFPVEELDEETMLAISDSQEFQDMTLYPAQGSVQVLDGRVVVKLQERYTPKSDFEKAYENRR
ncbi:glucosyltransferase domain-containing protein [Pseudoflavonifractor phocaeensis]|uniref:glucosyltransferase domain-containing protein n=1 Tax=Pseudoflavonifractor phocaeensis TaxID=1870988 RepID=UPI001F474984|nr:glucosyltransferase domain-containing protein [Pseudoflavonifractor phocaeensis]MCF2661127.1 glucosyltransferase domain-containing protein [Pseudoflavonifractor phocaeensis]